MFSIWFPTNGLAWSPMRSRLILEGLKQRLIRFPDLVSCIRLGAVKTPSPAASCAYREPHADHEPGAIRCHEPRKRECPTQTLI
jgi:hypothetical protein